MRTTGERGTWAALPVPTYLDGAEDPEDQRLHDRQGRSADAEDEVDADVLANLGVSAGIGVSFGPVLQPEVPT